MKTPRHFWQDMRTTDFDPADCESWIAVLPLAATEQHGPHLPLATDALIAEGMVRAVCDELPASLPATFLPIQPVGKSDEHSSLPGTLTIGWDTLIKAWLDIAAGVHRAGVRKLVLVSSHGGNMPVMDIIAQELRMKYDMLCVVTSWQRMGLPEGVFTREEQAFGIHGGAIETSLMLHLHVHLVDRERAENFYSQQKGFVKEFKHLRGYGPNGFGWNMQDLNPQGVVGDASAATAEKGKAVLEYQAKRFVEVLQDVHAFDMAHLWQGR